MKKPNLIPHLVKVLNKEEIYYMKCSEYHVKVDTLNFYSTGRVTQDVMGSGVVNIRERCGIPEFINLIREELSDSQMITDSTYREAMQEANEINPIEGFQFG